MCRPDGRLGEPFWVPGPGAEPARDALPYGSIGGVSVFARTLLGVLLLVCSAGCDRRLEPWVDKEAELPPTERPVHVPGLDAPIVRSQPGATRASRSERGSKAAPIRGTLQLATGEEPAPGGVLFLIARTSPVGPPLAVRRLPVGPFPMDFEIGPGDVMIPGMPFAGAIHITARIDADGDPLTPAAAGDLQGALAGPVGPGASDVQLILRASDG